MVLNSMVIRQANNLYYIFSPQGELRAIVAAPPDGQMMANFSMFEMITRALGIRWGIISPKSRQKKRQRHRHQTSEKEW